MLWRKAVHVEGQTKECRAGANQRRDTEPVCKKQFNSSPQVMNLKAIMRWRRKHRAVGHELK
eukprot:1114757-Pelagomonas_calceolata.AAC.6